MISLIKIGLALPQHGQGLSIPMSTIDLKSGLRLTVKINIGNQDFEVIPDTGSSYLWVPGIDCSGTCGISRFDSSKSKTYTQGNKSEIKLNYAVGQVTGTVNDDILTIAGLQINSSFILVDSQAENSGTPGILGLGFVDTSATMMNLPVVTISEQHKTSRVISMYLSRNEGKDNSEMTIGGINNDRYIGELTYSPLFELDVIRQVSNGRVNKLLWAVSITPGFGNLTFPSPQAAIIDSGTSNILISASYAKSINELIGASISDYYPETNTTKYSVDCNLDMSTFPDLQLNINNVHLKLTANDYIDRVPHENGAEICLSLIQGLESQLEPIWTLGNIFQRNYYTVFDMDENRFGFATAKHQ